MRTMLLSEVAFDTTLPNSKQGRHWNPRKQWSSPIALKLEKGHLRIQTIVDQLSEEKEKANNNRDQSEEHIPFITEQPLNDDHNTNPNEDIESNNDKFDRDSSLCLPEE